jgi:hypothetical protein
MDGQDIRRLPPLTDSLDRPLIWSRSLPLLVILAALAYGWLVYLFVSPYAGGSDSSGYLNFARSLTHGKLLAPVRVLPGYPVTEFGSGTYQPGGYTIRDDSGTMIPTYPIGFPMHVAVAAFLIGSDNAVAFINVLLALAGLALMYASCRYLKLSPVWSAGATLALAVCPYFIISALQPMSDLPAMTWALGTLYAAMRSRDRTSWAILCGTAASMALLVRPSNLLLALPLLVAFGLSPTRYALGLLGAVPGLLFAAYVNWRLHGAPPFWHTTGYDSPMEILNAFTADASQLWSVAHFPHHASYFVLWILSYMGPLVICGIVLPFSPRGRTREWMIHAVWFTALFLPYAMLRPAGEAWWYLRYLLPAFPSLILLATGGLSILWDNFAPSTRSALVRLVNRAHRRLWPPGFPTTTRYALKGAAGLAIILLSVGWMAIATARLSLFSLRSSEQIYPDAALWARNHAPSNAMIICSGFSGAIYYYTDLPIVRFDGFAPGKARAFLGAASAQSRPLYAILWPYELDDARRLVDGNWKKVAEIGEQKIAVLQLVR